MFFRKPLDEKLYDRDLEAALTLSLLKTAEINEEQCSYNPGLHWTVDSLQLVFETLLFNSKTAIWRGLAHW